MLSARPSGTPMCSGSTDFTKECGTACRLLLAKEIPGLRYSRRARAHNRYPQLIVTSECFTSLFAQTDKISSPRSTHWKSAESNSNSKITRSRTPFISANPDGHQLEITTYELPKRP